MGWWWERGGASEAPIYDLRFTIWMLARSARRCAAKAKVEEGAWDGGGRKGAGRRRRLFTMDDLRLFSQMRLPWGLGRVSSSFLPSPGNQFPEARIPLHSGKRSFSY